MSSDKSSASRDDRLRELLEKWETAQYNERVAWKQLLISWAIGWTMIGFALGFLFCLYR